MRARLLSPPLKRAPPMRKRVAISREYVNEQLRLVIAMDGIYFWADMHKAAIAQLGIRKVCRLARDVLRNNALQRRLKLLAEPGPSRMVH